jgi:hypothetical protein
MVEARKKEVELEEIDPENFPEVPAAGESRPRPEPAPETMAPEAIAPEVIAQEASASSAAGVEPAVPPPTESSVA